MTFELRRALFDKGARTLLVILGLRANGRRESFILEVGRLLRHHRTIVRGVTDVNQHSPRRVENPVDKWGDCP